MTRARRRTLTARAACWGPRRGACRAPYRGACRAACRGVCWAACRGAMARDLRASRAGACAPVASPFVVSLSVPYAVFRISTQRTAAPTSEAVAFASGCGAVALCSGMWSSRPLLRDVEQWPVASGCGAAAWCVPGWSSEFLRRNVERRGLALGCGAIALCSERWSSGLCVGMRGSGALLQDVEQRGVAPGCGARHRAPERPRGLRLRPPVGGRP